MRRVRARGKAEAERRNQMVTRILMSNALPATANKMTRGSLALSRRAPLMQQRSHDGIGTQPPLPVMIDSSAARASIVGGMMVSPISSALKPLDKSSASQQLPSNANGLFTFGQGLMAQAPPPSLHLGHAPSIDHPPPLRRLPIPPDTMLHSNLRQWRGSPLEARGAGHQIVGYPSGRRHLWRSLDKVTVCEDLYASASV
jgi:hypothetical protein